MHAMKRFISLQVKKFIPYKENDSLQQFVKAVKAQTKNDYKNITQSLGFAVKGNDGKLGFKPVAKFYQQTLDKATAGIISGTFDYNTIIKQAVNDMTNSGLRTVDYENGRSNRIEVAVRRAILTGVNQITAQINNEVAEQLGTEYFEVSYHRGARPTHQVWQGRVYSKQDLEIVCGLGTVTGLCGANCRHSYSPFVIGISQRTYTDDELERMNDEENTPKEYNGKQYTLYEATQRQRKLETLMRKQREDIKLLEAGKAGDNEINAAKARYFSTSDDSVAKLDRSGIIKSKECEIAPDKINKFFLKPNAKHSDDFFNIGYKVTDFELLDKDLKACFDYSKAVDKVVFDNGVERFSIFTELGVNEKKRFRTVWQKDTPESTPHIITAHREDER